MQIEVMTTKTWAYFYSMLDRARKIKAHVLKPGTSRSYCGLQNHDDVGEMSWQEFLSFSVDACSRCRRLTILAPDYCFYCDEKKPPAKQSICQDCVRLITRNSG